jgi:hypothetical protein
MAHVHLSIGCWIIKNGMCVMCSSSESVSIVFHMFADFFLKMCAVITYISLRNHLTRALFFFPPKATDLSHSSHVFGEEKLWLASNNDGDYLNFEPLHSKADTIATKQRLTGR